MRRNAFGQLVQSPRLRFAKDDPSDKTGGDKDQKSKDDKDDKSKSDDDLGFPKDTPIAEMTPAQEAAYWKFQSRKHELEAKSRKDYDQLKAEAEELRVLKAKNATEDEKALEQARQEGENIGAQRYLKDAVKGHFRALTGMSKDDVDDAFDHVDASSFVDKGGDVDVDAIEKFANTFGIRQESASKDNYSGTARRIRQDQKSGAGSISERRKQYAEEHSTKKG